MTVFSIWEFRYPPDALSEGTDVAQAIWRDMQAYDGYIRHVIVEDVDDAGHLVVVSEWRSREDADRVLAEYADSPNRRRADELVAEPRRRIVGQPLAT